jgi:hypothetical protein
MEPVQDLNLKCRSISGLEPEMPVTPGHGLTKIEKPNSNEYSDL